VNQRRQEKMQARHVKPESLADACVREAIAIIGEHGLEKLSLREVARRLGVSHQAPYKHFASREHLLAEVVRQTFADFAAHLDRRPQHEDKQRSLAEMGASYLKYALDHPLQYRLMFATPLPEPREHPEMMHTAQHAFCLLVEAIAALHGSKPATVSSKAITQLDALFVWSAMHGLAALLTSDAIKTLELPKTVIGEAADHTLMRIGSALTAAHPRKRATQKKPPAGAGARAGGGG